MKRRQKRSKSTETILHNTKHIRYKGRGRAVMNEFGALVEEGRIVFIGLDDEQWTLGLVARRNLQIIGDAANQEVGSPARMLEYPGQHGAAGGFAVCAGHRSEEHTSELQSLMRTSYAVFCVIKNNKT